MTFFYNLNQKLDEIRATPELTHKQLNERDMSRAAKGYEKYGKEGMEALAKAGREGKALDPVRNKYDKYDNTEVDEGLGDMARKAAGAVGGAVNKVVDRLSGQAAQDAKWQERLNRTTEFQKARSSQGEQNRIDSRSQEQEFDRLQGKNEGIGDMVRKVGGMAKKVASKAMDTVGHGSDADMIRDLQKKMGVPQTGMKPGSEPNPKQVKEKMNPAKAKSFAALAPPTDKITFADKIAGAKKEVDEMLGDVAADAMKKALGGGKGRNAEMEEGSEDNAFTAHKRPRVEVPKVGTITHGRKHDVEEIPGGRRVTRRVDPSGISVGADDEAAQSGEKRGRGRPKKAGGPAQERVTAKSRKADRTTFQSKKVKEGAGPDDMAVLERLMDEAFAEGNNALGNAIQGVLEKMGAGDEEQVNEKAVSKKQQKFMGMVHAAQKGEKPASKEVAKVAKTMKKGDAEDFASTKHKGLPEKKKPEGKKDSGTEAPKKKKEKTEEAGGSGTPTASSGFSYGKGIYDSMNRDLEDMISESMQDLRESMSINMSMNNDGDMHGGASKSLTVTATDEDAVTLSQLLKSAGLGGGSEGGCGCGGSPCSCGSNAEVVDENQPDWPTDTEQAQDNFGYAGGLNKPKSTGQTTVPVIASQDERQESYAAEEEDAIKRMMEMAGVKKKEVDEEKTEEGNKFTGNLAKARADGKEEADLDGDGDMEKVKESIFSLTNQWKAYKG